MVTDLRIVKTEFDHAPDPAGKFFRPAGVDAEHMAYDARRYLLRVVDGRVGATVFDKSVNQFIAERFGVGAVLFYRCRCEEGQDQST